MQRAPLIALLAAAALAGPVAGADADSRPPLAATLVGCTTGDAPAVRSATFTGSMPAVDGADRMQMRFRLLQRRGLRGRFHRVEVPDWIVPERSDPGRPGFVFTKRIERLLAPAAYRARIVFTWLDAHGHVLRRARRTTGTCLQPDPRPNLLVGRVTGVRTGRGHAAYGVAVVNDGGADAPPFAVTLTVGDTTVGPVTVDGLASGDKEIAALAGPVCRPGSTLVVALDVDGAVAQSRRDDDVVRRRCPLGP